MDTIVHGSWRDHPVQQGEWYRIGQLRSIAAQILSDRQADQNLSAKMRAHTLPWAKSWNEELYPLKLLADHKRFGDDDTFRWTPFGASDFEVRASDAIIKIQSTMSYAERDGTIGKQGGHVRKLEMIKYNNDGYAFGGGLVSVPRARSEEEDVEAWRVGIARARTNKLRVEYIGCRLLIFAPRCSFDTIDFDFEEVVMPAIATVGRAAWGNVFEGLYILDEPASAFVELAC